jgi:hypothetical protein
VQAVEKVERHAAGQLLAETITVQQTFVAAHVAMTGQFAEHKVAHTNHGADLTHGHIFLAVLLLVLDLEFLEHTAVNLGWAAI